MWIGRCDDGRAPHSGAAGGAELPWATSRALQHTQARRRPALHFRHDATSAPLPSHSTGLWVGDPQALPPLTSHARMMACGVHFSACAPHSAFMTIKRYYSRPARCFVAGGGGHRAAPKQQRIQSFERASTGAGGRRQAPPGCTHPPNVSPPFTPRSGNDSSRPRVRWRPSRQRLVMAPKKRPASQGPLELAANSTPEEVLQWLVEAVGVPRPTVQKASWTFGLPRLARVLRRAASVLGRSANARLPICQTPSCAWLLPSAPRAPGAAAAA